MMKISKTLPGITNDEAAEHSSDTSSWAGHADCGGSSTNELGSGVNVPGNCTGLEGAAQDCRLADWQQGLKEKDTNNDMRAACVFVSYVI